MAGTKIYIRRGVVIGANDHVPPVDESRTYKRGEEVQVTARAASMLCDQAGDPSGQRYPLDEDPPTNEDGSPAVFDPDMGRRDQEREAAASGRRGRRARAEEAEAPAE